MSMQTRQPTANDLLWWDCEIGAWKDGGPITYFCQFLAHNHDAVADRITNFLLKEGAALRSSTVVSSKHGPQYGKAHNLVSQDPRRLVHKEKEEERVTPVEPEKARMVRAFGLYPPIEIKPTLYIQLGEGV